MLYSRRPTGMGHYELVPGAGASAEERERALEPWRAEWELDGLLARHPARMLVGAPIHEEFAPFASSSHAGLRDAVRTGRLLLLRPAEEVSEEVVDELLEPDEGP